MIQKKGFTLIELLVVIAIIAILSAIGLVALNGAREKARDAQRRSDIAQIRTALSLYYDDNGFTYPNEAGQGASTAIATDNIPDASNNSQDAGAVGTTLAPAGTLTDDYLAQALNGPTANGGATIGQDHYWYVTNQASTAVPAIADATHYLVFTQLEAAGGDNWYGINEEGTVWDIDDAVTAIDPVAAGGVTAICDNTATPVCTF